MLNIILFVFLVFYFYWVLKSKKKMNILFFLFKKSYIFWLFLFNKKFIINYEKIEKQTI